MLYAKCKEKCELEDNLTDLNMCCYWCDKRAACVNPCRSEVISMKKHNYEDCKYCCDDVDMRDYLLSDGCNGVYIDGNGNLCGDDEFNFEYKKLNCCPMCGRKF